MTDKTYNSKTAKKLYDYDNCKCFHCTRGLKYYCKLKYLKDEIINFKNELKEIINKNDKDITRIDIIEELIQEIEQVENAK